jgi:hypothetical protein
VKRASSLLVGLLLLVAAGSSSLAQTPRPQRSWRDQRGPPPAVVGRAPAFRGPPVRRGFVPPPPPPYAQRPADPRFFLGPNSLGADWRAQQDEARQGVRRGQLAPLGRVIDGIARRSPGRQLDAGLESDNGRMVYRVRWMTDRGRRIDYIVDAATGQILSER